MRKRRINYIGRPAKRYTGKRRRTYGKLTKHILVWIAIVVSNAGAVITKSASLFEVITFTLLVLVPVLYKSFRYDMDPWLMYPGTLLRTGIWLGLFLGTIPLSERFPGLEKFFMWPVI